MDMLYFTKSNGYVDRIIDKPLLNLCTYSDQFSGRRETPKL